MSKIFVKRSIRKTLQIFWKQLGGWATDFAYKYQYDIFFRTKFRVIGLEFLFLLIVFAVLFFISTHEFEGMSQTIAAFVQESIGNISLSSLLLILLWGIGGTFLFGYVIAHIALKPTRNALSSQKQFIGNIAHELRTPLSIIKTNMEVTLLEQRLDERMRESLADNVDELDRTSDIINNLLSFNTLQNPEQIPFSNIDLGYIVDEVIKKLSPLAEGKNIEVSLQKGEFLTVWGNASALEQISMNVTKNALAYTEKGGQVNISVAPNYRGHIELCASDNGIGISHNKLLRVFEPFYRAEQSRAKRHGGSGLGLTIVSELVKLHSGKISIKSKEGTGTSVLIALPCGHTEATLSIEDNDDVIARDFSNHRNPAQAPSRPQPNRPGKSKVKY